MVSKWMAGFCRIPQGHFLCRSGKAWVTNDTEGHVVGKIPGSLNKADVGTKHVAREDLLRHIRALGWQAPDENPRASLNDVASNFLPGRSTPKFGGLLLSFEAGCQRNSMFLTRCTSVDSVNSESCSEVVFFCAITVVCKRHRFVFQHSFPSQCRVCR